MAKSIKAALLVAVAVFIPAALVVGFQGTALTFAAGGLTALGMTAMAFGTTLVSSLVGGMTSKVSMLQAVILALSFLQEMQQHLDN